MNQDQDSPKETNENHSGGASKQVNLGSLTKEELVEKCKNLINILKKAKLAKDDAVLDAEKAKKERMQSLLSHERERNQMEEQANALKEMLTNFTEKEMSYVTKNESLQRQLKLQYSEVEELQATEKNLLSELQELQLEHDKFAKAVTKQQRIIEKLTDTREQEKQNSIQEKQTLSEKIDELQSQLSQMKEFKHNYKELLDQKSQMEKELKEKQVSDAENISLQDCIQALQNEQKALNIINENLKSDNRHLTGELEASKKSCDDLNEKEQLCNDLSARLAEAEMNLLQWKQKEADHSQVRDLELEKLNILTEEARHLLEDKSSLDKQLCESLKNAECLSCDVKKLLDENMELKAALDESVRGEAILENLQSELTSLKDELCSLSKEKDGLLASVDALTLQREQQNSAITDLNLQLTSLSAEKEAWFETNKQIKELHGEKASMSKLVLSLEKEREDLQSALGNEELGLKEMENNLNQLQEEKKQTEDKNHCLEKEVKSSLIKHQKLTEITKEETEKYCTEISLLKEHNNSIQNDLMKQVECFGKLKTENECLENSIKDLTQKIQMLKSGNEALNDDSSKFNQVESKLKEELNLGRDKLVAADVELETSNGKLQELSVLYGDLKDSIIELIDKISALLNIKNSECPWDDRLRSVIQCLNQRSKEYDNNNMMNMVSGFASSSKVVGMASQSLSVTETNTVEELLESVLDFLTFSENVASTLNSLFGLNSLNEIKSGIGDIKSNLPSLVKCYKEVSNASIRVNVLTEEKTSLERTIQDLRDALEEKGTILSKGREDSALYLRHVKEQLSSLIEADGDSGHELHQPAGEYEGERKAIESMIKVFLEEIQSKRKESSDMGNTLRSTRSNHQTELKNIQKLSEELSCSLTENSGLHQQLKIANEALIGLENELASLNQSCSSLRDEQRVMTATYEEVNNRRLLLESQLISLELELREVLDIRDNLTKETKILHDKLTNAKKLIETQNSQLEKVNIHQGIEGSQHSIAANGEEEDQQAGGVAGEGATSHDSDLINELNIMNQALRERGERISRLSDQIREKNNSTEKLEASLLKVQNKVLVKEAELTDKTEELKQLQTSPEGENTISQLKNDVVLLREENEQLKKAARSASATAKDLLSPPADASQGNVAVDQSEIASTSTFSKVEDVHRMKELEDTFEERYMKLKSVAIKLKKRLAEQGAELKSSEEARKRLAEERLELQKRADATPSRNIQALQDAVDRMQDAAEAKSKELKERDQQLLNSATELSQLKLNFANCQEETLHLSTLVREKENLLLDVRHECTSAKAEVIQTEAALETERKSVAVERENYNLIQQNLKEEKQRKERVLKELEDLRQECKRFSLIDLEMKDYEKTIEKLSSQLSETGAIFQETQGHLHSQTSKIRNLNEQISMLQSQREAESEAACKLKNCSEEQKNQIDDLRSSLSEQSRQITQDKSCIEELNQQIEKQKLFMAEVTSEHSNTETSLRKAKEIAQKKEFELESLVTNYKNDNAILSAELKDLKENFEVYKLRAQSVLRQKSKVPSESDINQLKTEKDQILSELEAANLLNQQFQSELAAAKAELGYVLSEKERCSQQALLASEEILKKERSTKAKLKTMEDKLHGSNAEYQRIISNMSHQSESMDKNYKGQLTSLKEMHRQEKKELLARSEEARAKLLEMSGGASKGLIKEARDTDETTLLSLSTNERTSEEDPRIDVSHMIREEGEGSEYVEPLPSRHPSQSQLLYNPPTLEHLINAPLPPAPFFDETSSLMSGVTEASNKDFIKLESKLIHVETRLQHVTSLLTESEAENAKLSELSDALKEEIRRVSRNENRERHLENNEYLKNVVLKFLVLKTGDEKSRLVPVLKTLLQLSPDESSQLSYLAKGDESAEVAAQGWSNYLHLWSGR